MFSKVAAQACDKQRGKGFERVQHDRNDDAG
jgi:hypothetical protein